MILELTGAEPEKYMLPPLVCLGQYRAEYGGELSLAAALLKELQGDELIRLYADETAGIYTFEMTKERFTCYLLVRGQEVYALWELACESDYSLGRLLRKGKVCWDTQENAWNEAEQDKVKYRIVEIEPGFSLAPRAKQKRIRDPLFQQAPDRFFRIFAPGSALLRALHLALQIRAERFSLQVDLRRDIDAVVEAGLGVVARV